jgi:hypothetical protein
MKFNVGDLIIINAYIKKKKHSIPAYVTALHEPDLEVGRTHESITYKFFDGREKRDWIINIEDRFTEKDKRDRWVHHRVK